jgi:putative hemin transport protein
MTNNTLEPTLDLAQRWSRLRVEQPKTRIRDAAASLGVSEAELLATTVDGHTVVRLDPRFRELLTGIPALGKVMALTRNDDVVHERKGLYEGVDTTGHAGIVLGPDIDLRIFFSEWVYGFGIQEASEQGTHRSLQFFDARGNSIHKIFVQDEHAAEAFTDLVSQYRATEQPTTLAVKPMATPVPEKSDTEIDQAGFQADWDALQDTHDFFPLLRKFGVSRTQALRLAGNQRAHRLPASVVRGLLESASNHETPVMIFVGNPGCIQIHTGLVRNIKVMGPWLNVMDPDFNLHLREDRIDSVWVVRKPTRDGVVTSVELFNAEGDNMALVFGKRKPGQTEDKGWQDLVAMLESDTAVRV